MENLNALARDESNRIADGSLVGQQNGFLRYAEICGFVRGLKEIPRVIESFQEISADSE